MKRMVDLDEMQYYAYLAYECNLSAEDILRLFIELGMKNRYIKFINCNDCRYYDPDIDGGYCKHYKRKKSPKDFCSDGQDVSTILS